MGKVIGCILFFGVFIFGILGFKALSAYRPEISTHFYFVSAFSCLVFGSICYELGNCSSYLEKILKNRAELLSSEAHTIQQESHEEEIADNENSVICKKCNHLIPTGTARCPKCQWIC